MAKGTLTGKILNSHLLKGAPVPGEPVEIRIDQTLTQDATGTMAYLELEAMKVPAAATELSVSYVDHNMMQNGPENRNDHLYLRSIAAARGVRFSPPGNGICHQVHLERFGRPGRTLLGSDSHTPTGGGIGMIAIGAGGLDVACAMAGRPFRMAYPKIIGVKLLNRLGDWCAAKDVILKLLSMLTTKGNVGCVVEYFGDGVKTLSVPQRATITNMGAELGVTTSIFPSDEATEQFLRAQRRGADFTALAADADAEYDDVITIDLAALEPLAACPSSPDNVKPIAAIAGTPVGQVIVGSCTNSSYRDLAMVAAVLDGRRIAPGVTFAVAPGSRQVLEMLAADGGLARMIAAGARILETGCGPCIGQGQSPADDTVSLRTFNRNFAGRTGTRGDQAYLVSCETAVASALTGVITDPRTLGISCPQIAEVEEFTVNDNMIELPPADPSEVEIIRKPTIGNPPETAPAPERLDAEIIIKAGDKITTDHIMPAGVHLKLRSNIPAYSKVVFECFNEPGKPGFAQRAAAVRDSGRWGVIAAGESYGQGSSREHAAICPAYLGIKAVAACSIERIHRANLINFGIVPLIFADPADLEAMTEGESFVIENFREQLRAGGVITASAGGRPVKFKCELNARDLEIILAGGLLNL